MKHSIGRLFGAAAAFAVLTTGCGAADDTPASTTAQSSSVTSQQETTATVQESAPETTTKATTAQTVQHSTAELVFSPDSLFSDRDRSGEYPQPSAVITCTGTSAAVEGSGAAVQDSIVTITQEGVYRITGTLENGQILVNADGKVQLVLDNADLTCADSAAIYVQQAKKCFLTLAAHSENRISDGASRTNPETQPDAAIFSEDSLTINGSGALHVSGCCNEGITCRDDIVITGGTLTVNAVGNGIEGKDYVACADGTIKVTSGADGIRSTNAESMGFVYIGGGTVTVDAAEDGIQAETQFYADGGTLQLTAGGGSANAEVKSSEPFRRGWGEWDTAQESTENSVSKKALKAGSLLWIAQGDFTLDAADDGLHSNGSVRISGGTLDILAGSDGIHADERVEISDGTVTISKSYEGIEGAGILISGGTTAITAVDDGINASDGTAQGGMGTYSSGVSLTVSGGSVSINAEGDGLDSNGDMLISGGTVLIDGTTNGGNGAMDGNGSMQCTGGLLIAAGSAGMAEYPDGTQCTAVITTDTVQAGGTELCILDETGKTLLSHTPAKSYQSVIISSPDFKEGTTLTITIGGTDIGTLTFSDTVAFLGNDASMMGGGQFPGGQFHGGRGERPEMPTDENGNPAMPEGIEFPDRMEMPTDENGNPAMPEGMEFPDRMEMPTDENGNPAMPEGMEFPDRMEMPTDENGNPAMPERHEPRW